MAGPNDPFTRSTSLRGEHAVPDRTAFRGRWLLSSYGYEDNERPSLPKRPAELLVTVSISPGNQNRDGVGARPA